ncbi:hypothetical protein [Actinomadura flavalba]|uniref:hypothetical protein n=1 Tax=Actinomadura flavalba TaxID=1120938 RepID=UPI00037181EA|nr:hypothetical protein [Actinomadura flavalba]
MSEQPGPGSSLGTPPSPGPGKTPDPGAPRRALWLGIGGLLMLLPFWPLGLLLGVAAVVVGVRARRDTRPVPSPAATAGITLGVLTTLFGALAVGVSVWLNPEQSAYSDCMDRANTHADEKICNDDFRKAIERKIPGDVPFPMLQN